MEGEFALPQWMREETIKSLENAGWIIEPFRCFKMHGKYEIDIEFCIGDFCVGIYDERLNLIPEEKIRCKSFAEAFISAVRLEMAYPLERQRV